MRCVVLSLIASCLTILVSGCVKNYPSEFCLRYKPIVDVDSPQVGKMNQIYACECLELTWKERREWCRKGTPL